MSNTETNILMAKGQKIKYNTKEIRIILEL